MPTEQELAQAKEVGNYIVNNAELPPLDAVFGSDYYRNSDSDGQLSIVDGYFDKAIQLHPSLGEDANFERNKNLFKSAIYNNKANEQITPLVPEGYGEEDAKWLREQFFTRASDYGRNPKEIPAVPVEPLPEALVEQQARIMSRWNPDVFSRKQSAYAIPNLYPTDIKRIRDKAIEMGVAAEDIDLHIMESKNIKPGTDAYNFAKKHGNELVRWLEQGGTTSSKVRPVMETLKNSYDLNAGQWAKDNWTSVDDVRRDGIEHGNIGTIFSWRVKPGLNGGNVQINLNKAETPHSGMWWWHKPTQYGGQQIIDTDLPADFTEGQMHGWIRSNWDKFGEEEQQALENIMGRDRGGGVLGTAQGAYDGFFRGAGQVTGGVGDVLTMATGGYDPSSPDASGWDAVNPVRWLGVVLRGNANDAYNRHAKSPIGITGDYEPGSWDWWVDNGSETVTTLGLQFLTGGAMLKGAKAAGMVRTGQIMTGGGFLARPAWSAKALSRWNMLGFMAPTFFSVTGNTYYDSFEYKTKVEGKSFEDAHNEANVEATTVGLASTAIEYLAGRLLFRNHKSRIGAGSWTRVLAQKGEAGVVKGLGEAGTEALQSLVETGGMKFLRGVPEHFDNDIALMHRLFGKFEWPEEQIRKSRMLTGATLGFASGKALGFAMHTPMMSTTELNAFKDRANAGLTTEVNTNIVVNEGDATLKAAGQEIHAETEMEASQIGRMINDIDMIERAIKKGKKAGLSEGEIQKLKDKAKDLEQQLSVPLSRQQGSLTPTTYAAYDSHSTARKQFAALTKLRKAGDVEGMANWIYNNRIKLQQTAAGLFGRNRTKAQKDQAWQEGKDKADTLAQAYMNHDGFEIVQFDDPKTNRTRYELRPKQAQVVDDGFAKSVNDIQSRFDALKLDPNATPQQAQDLLNRINALNQTVPNSPFSRVAPTRGNRVATSLNRPKPPSDPTVGPEAFSRPAPPSTPTQFDQTTDRTVGPEAFSRPAQVVSSARLTRPAPDFQSTPDIAPEATQEATPTPDVGQETNPDIIDPPAQSTEQSIAEIEAALDEAKSLLPENNPDPVDNTADDAPPTEIVTEQEAINVSSPDASASDPSPLQQMVEDPAVADAIPEQEIAEEVEEEFEDTDAYEDLLSPALDVTQGMVGDQEVDVDVEPEVAPQPEVAPEPEVVPEPAPEPEVAPEPAPEPVVTPEPEVAPEPEPEPVAPAPPTEFSHNGVTESAIRLALKPPSRQGRTKSDMVEWLVKAGLLAKNFPLGKQKAADYAIQALNDLKAKAEADPNYRPEQDANTPEERARRLRDAMRLLDTVDVDEAVQHFDEASIDWDAEPTAEQLAEMDEVVQAAREATLSDFEKAFAGHGMSEGDLRNVLRDPVKTAPEPEEKTRAVVALGTRQFYNRAFQGEDIRQIRKEFDQQLEGRSEEDVARKMRQGKMTPEGGLAQMIEDMWRPIKWAHDQAVKEGRVGQDQEQQAPKEEAKTDGFDPRAFYHRNNKNDQVLADKLDETSQEGLDSILDALGIDVEPDAMRGKKMALIMREARTSEETDLDASQSQSDAFSRPAKKGMKVGDRPHRLQDGSTIIPSEVINYVAKALKKGWNWVRTAYHAINQWGQGIYDYLSNVWVSGVDKLANYVKSLEGPMPEYLQRRDGTTRSYSGFPLENSSNEQGSPRSPKGRDQRTYKGDGSDLDSDYRRRMGEDWDEVQDILNRFHDWNKQFQDTAEGERRTTVERLKAEGKLDGSDEQFQARRKEKFKIQENLWDMIKNGASYLFTPISTILGNISPALRVALRAFEWQLLERTAAWINRAKPLINKFAEMEGPMGQRTLKIPVEQRKQFNDAVMNGDFESARLLADRYNFREEFEDVVKLLDEVYKQSKKTGRDFGYLENYWPRSVKSAKHFLDFMYGTVGSVEMDRVVAEQERNNGVALGPDEVSQVINEHMYRLSKGLAKPGNMNPRQIEKLSQQMMEFHHSFDQSLVTYLTRMAKDVTMRKWYGKKITDAPDASNTIGGVFKDLLDEGQLNHHTEARIKQVLMDRMHYKHSNRFVSGVKSVGYMITIANPISAMTQLADLAQSTFENGWKHGLLPMTGKEKILTTQDYNVEQAFLEMVNPNAPQALSRFLDKMFTYSGFAMMDRFGKSQIVNGYFARIRDTMSLDDFYKEVQHSTPWLKDSPEQIYQDIKARKVTDDIRFLAFQKILDYHPVALSELPRGYINHPNGRIAYMLKTFSIKFLDTLRRNSTLQMRNGDVMGGMKNLAKLSALFVLAGTGSDSLKDMVLYNETEVSDTVIDNIYKMVLLNKYSADRLTSGNARALDQGIKDTVMSNPVLQMSSRMFGKGTKFVSAMLGGGQQTMLDVWAQDDRIIEGIPVVGKLYSNGLHFPFLGGYGGTDTARKRWEERTFTRMRTENMSRYNGMARKWKPIAEKLEAGQKLTPEESAFADHWEEMEAKFGHGLRAKTEKLMKKAIENRDMSLAEKLNEQIGYMQQNPEAAAEMRHIIEAQLAESERLLEKEKKDPLPSSSFWEDINAY